MQTQWDLSLSACLCQYHSPYKDTSSITSKRAREKGNNKKKKQNNPYNFRADTWKKKISTYSGLHAVFLLLIRINRYEHLPLFHNQKTGLFQRNSVPVASSIEENRKNTCPAPTGLATYVAYATLTIFSTSVKTSCTVTLMPTYKEGGSGERRLKRYIHHRQLS